MIYLQNEFDELIKKTKISTPNIDILQLIYTSKIKVIDETEYKY